VTALSTAPYRRALSSRELRTVLIVGILARMPTFAVGVLVTLHVVTTLNGSYSRAGLIAAIATIATAVSGPWRGRLLDRVGLRRVIAPSTAVGLVCWAIAPWVGFWPLLVLVGIAQLFVVPFFSIGRQAVIAAVRDEDRRTAIALDSAAVEVSYIIAPAVAVIAASRWGTSWVLFWVQMLGVAGGVLLWVVNPRIKALGEALADARPVARRTWFRLPFLGVCLAAASATLVLAGSDLAIVAAVRSFGEQSLIGVVLALWGLGSLIGGLVYGAWHRPVPAFWLLAGLALVTFPLAVAANLTALAAFAFLAGLLCAPTITATVDQASRAVPAESRGEAMGWHGSFLTAGGTLGAPLAGFAIDHYHGAAGGFVMVAVVGLAVAVAGLLAPLARGRSSVPVVRPARVNVPSS
jgi:MFS family permease